MSGFSQKYSVLPLTKPGNNFTLLRPGTMSPSISPRAAANITDETPVQFPETFDDPGRFRAALDDLAMRQNKEVIEPARSPTILTSVVLLFLVACYVCV